MQVQKSMCERQMGRSSQFARVGGLLTARILHRLCFLIGGELSGGQDSLAGSSV